MEELIEENERTIEKLNFKDCQNEFNELLSLIKIREYVFYSINLPTISKTAVNELNGILLLLDDKIISFLTGSIFKEYIGYKDVQAAKERAAKINNIYSSIRK